VNLNVAAGETMNFSGFPTTCARSTSTRAGRFWITLVVNIRPISLGGKKRYAREAALPVENDIDAIYQMGWKVNGGETGAHSGKVRHDPGATRRWW